LRWQGEERKKVMWRNTLWLRVGFCTIPLKFAAYGHLVGGGFIIRKGLVGVQILLD